MKITMTALATAAVLLSQAAFAEPYYHSRWHHRAYYAHQAHCYYVRTAHGRRVYECYY